MKTNLPSGYISGLHNGDNLTNENIPQWWSERYWQLLVNSAKTLLAFGNDTILIPLVDGDQQALIQNRV